MVSIKSSFYDGIVLVIEVARRQNQYFQNHQEPYA